MAICVFHYMMNEMLQNSLRPNQPRLGLINYINSLPIVLPIIQGLVKVDAQLILAEPSKLNALFAAGELEYGAMSAYAFLQQENLVLIPTVSISSQTTVSSVLLFSKKPIEQSTLLKVAVPTGSATSVNALLLLLAQYQKDSPALVAVAQPALEDKELDGALVIGDRALLIDEEWSKKYCRYDLGKWWYEAFNLPMVFGVFALRTNWVNEDDTNIKILIEQIGDNLKEASRLGLGRYFENVLDEAERRTGLPRHRLKLYYRNDLDFGWSVKHQQSLEKYRVLCQQLGILVPNDKKYLLKR